MPSSLGFRANEQALEAFTWGYHGWGNQSRHFVRAVDDTEHLRGFTSPHFVDMRISRGGRAADFHGATFAGILGPDRYQWMPELGNPHISSKRGPRIQIADPSAAERLLDHVIEAHRRRQRIIIFCHCLEPVLKQDDGYPSCHRVEVGTLLLKAAARRHIALTISEWPGSAPASVQIEGGPLQIKALKTAARYVPIAAAGRDPPPTAAIGWGSTITFSCDTQRWTIVTGPAMVRSGYWRHEVIEVSPEELRKIGYGPRSTLG